VGPETLAENDKISIGGQPTSPRASIVHAAVKYRQNRKRGDRLFEFSDSHRRCAPRTDCEMLGEDGPADFWDSGEMVGWHDPR
jgi:hypothetical protein